MLKIARYGTWEEVQELKELWNHLLSESKSDTVFLTWEWCAAWWRNYGAGRNLAILAAWEEREVVGIAPFYVDKVHSYGSDWKTLRLIGDGSEDSDYLDCFVRQGREKEAIAAFGEFLELHRGLWDLLDLNGPRQQSPCVAAMVAWAGERHWKCTSSVIPCATLSLPDTWETYLKLLEPRFRTKVRSSLAMIDQHLRSTPLECNTNERIDSWLPQLFDLHTHRWSMSSHPGVFRGTQKQSFYRDLSLAALEAGWLAFHGLNWGERPLAFQYGLVYRNCFHLLQEAYNPDFGQIRPGIALRAWLLRHWIAAGLREYDFLAGAANYKMEWGARRTFVVRKLLAAKRTSTITCLELPRLQTGTKEVIRRITPYKLLSLRKAFFSWRQRRQWGPARGAEIVADRHIMSRTGRWLVSRFYSRTPLGSVGRRLASHYAWERGHARNRFVPLRHRDQPVCQIFLYHRINDDGDPFISGIPLSIFKRQMEYLARNFPVITLDQLASEDFSDGHPYYVAVTFDDGYRDNFVSAFPVLKNLGIPATIFLATGYIDSGELPWYDQVRLAFKLTKRAHFSTADLAGPKGSLEGISDRLRNLEETLAWLRRMQQKERPEAIRELFRVLGVPSALSLPNQMLKWDEIRQMSRQNITFGAHTVSHPALSKIPESEMREEVLGSKLAVEDRLQLPVSHFAYPFGEPFDFNVRVKRTVEESGFKSAVTTIWGLNRPNDDRFELRRFNPWEADPAVFQLKLDWYRFREPVGR